MKLSPLLAVLLAAAPASAAPKRKRPGARAAKAAHRAAAPRPKAEAPAPRPVASAAAAPVAEAPAPASPRRADASLSALGAALDEDASGLLSCEPVPGRPAERMGLRAGDRVWFIDRAAVATREEAAAARRASSAEMRESMIVRRGLETLALDGPESPSPRDFERGSSDLSERELRLAEARAARAAAHAHDAVAEAAPLDWNLRADQTFWVRFAKGLPAGLNAGDVVQAEVATGLTTDGALDFLAVPPHSQAWARVVAAADDGSVRTVRLAFFKLRPAGGGVYPISGVVTASAGGLSADLTRVSGGGTVFAADPLPSADGKKPRNPGLVLDENARLRVRLLEPAALAEAPSWWRAGPGLWIKTGIDGQGRRVFQVTHLVTGRSAAAAGLKIGDVLESVGGRSSARLDFEEALDELYGPPGSTVRVAVVRPEGTKTLALTRGMKYDAKGAAQPLSLPFESR